MAPRARVCVRRPPDPSCLPRVASWTTCLPCRRHTRPCACPPLPLAVRELSFIACPPVPVSLPSFYSLCVRVQGQQDRVDDAGLASRPPSSRCSTRSLFFVCTGYSRPYFAKVLLPENVEGPARAVWAKTAAGPAVCVIIQYLVGFKMYVSGVCVWVCVHLSMCSTVCACAR